MTANICGYSVWGTPTRSKRRVLSQGVRWEAKRHPALDTAASSPQILESLRLTVTLHDSPNAPRPSESVPSLESSGVATPLQGLNRRR